MKTQFLPVLLILFGFTLAACNPTNDEAAVTQEFTPTVFRQGASQTPEPSLAPTSTPTLTPMPTPTALPIGVSGNPRGILLFDPLPQPNAPCGWVDILDYPLKPPDGEGATLRQDFGNFRERHQKFHAGEDWWLTSGSNFGEPVYSIGHGLVTYAEPEGWGLDKGVVIIQHVFQDGGKILSFYGHLDPPSVTLQPGACIRRGDPVGRIGRPRTPPHLHFEMRSHMPISPGPGYWATDPTTAGWVAPSQLIWQNRAETARGVVWARTQESNRMQGVGGLADGTFVAIDQQTLIGLNAQDGALAWSEPLTSTSALAAIDVDMHTIYTLDRLGRLQAFSGALGSLQSQWQVDLDAHGAVALLPLPAGGVLAQVGDWVYGVSREADILWEMADVAPIDGGVRGAENLFLSTGDVGGDIWRVSEGPPGKLDLGLHGPLHYRNGELFILSEDSVYAVNIANLQAELVYALPKSTRETSDFLPLQDGSLLLARQDSAGRHLILLSRQGEILWQRSLMNLPAGEFRLSLLDGQVYLLIRGNTAGYDITELYSIDLVERSLTKIFETYARGWPSNSAWIQPFENRLLVFNTSGGLIALEPKTALEAIGGISP